MAAPSRRWTSGRPLWQALSNQRVPRQTEDEAAANGAETENLGSEAVVKDFAPK